MRKPRIRIGDLLLGTVVCLILLFLMAPALVVIPVSFAGDAMTRFPPQQFSLDAYRGFISGPGWINSTIFSLKMALAVMVLAVVVGASTAYGIFKLSRSGQRVMTVIVLLPMLVPTIIFAIAIYGLLASMGTLGTMAGFVIANLVLALPYAIIAIRNGMEKLDWTLMPAASVLGARPLRVLFKIGIPLLMPSLLSAALFSFLIAFDEVVVAQFISSPFATPLAKRMWDGILFRFDPAISAISTIQIAITVIVLVALGLVNRARPK